MRVVRSEQSSWGDIKKADLGRHQVSSSSVPAVSVVSENVTESLCLQCSSLLEILINSSTYETMKLCGNETYLFRTSACCVGAVFSSAIICKYFFPKASRWVRTMILVSDHLPSFDTFSITLSGGLKVDGASLSASGVLISVFIHIQYQYEVELILILNRQLILIFYWILNIEPSLHTKPKHVIK